jgi:hypothetical protein
MQTAYDLLVRPHKKARTAKNPMLSWVYLLGPVPCIFRLAFFLRAIT